MKRSGITPRAFFGSAGAGMVGLDVVSSVRAAKVAIPGFEGETARSKAVGVWQPVSDRKFRMGIVAHLSALKDGKLLNIPQ